MTMATMVSEVYDALLEAGASQEKARGAAEAVAAFDNRFAGMEQKSAADFGEVKREIVGLRAELTLVKWMLGFVLAGVAALILQAFFP